MQKEALPQPDEQAESKELLAKQKGFSVGVIVAEKGLTEKSKLYEIVTIGDDVELVESDPFKEEKGLTNHNLKIDTSLILSHNNSSPTVVTS